MKNLIVNADDFGLTESASLAIAEAFDKKLISSTTVCANGEYFENSLLLAKAKGFADRIGVHLNITEGTPLTEDIKGEPFFCRDGVFHGNIKRLKPLKKRTLIAFKKEITAQLKKVIDAGIIPTHIDSHHHIHTCMFLNKTVKEVAKEFEIDKIRIHRNVGKIKFYKKPGKKIYNRKLIKQGFICTQKFGSAEDFFENKNLISDYICEIMVHPDFNKDGVLIDRVDEINGFYIGQPLDKISELLKGISLIGYGELK